MKKVYFILKKPYKNTNISYKTYDIVRMLIDFSTKTRIIVIIKRKNKKIYILDISVKITNYPMSHPHI